jgi:hypothetical protein
MIDDPNYCTVSGNEPVNPRSAATPTDETRGDGQKADHWVMCPGEIIRAGFKRPIRTSYQHTVCGTVTSMPRQIAETYAADPSYYNSTWCCGCKAYLPVGSDGNFVWDNTQDKVGT